MAHYIVTYDIDNATNRADFVAEFEAKLQYIGLRKEKKRTTNLLILVTIHKPK